MKIIIDRPPNFKDIVSVFPMASNKGVIFAFNNSIYNPSNIIITPELMAHERVHCARQGNEANTLEWWNSYLNDPDFRYYEELLAHSQEYMTLADNASNRNQKRSALKSVANKLASPLYGRMVSPKQAGKQIFNRAVDMIEADMIKERLYK